jgi:hypothetical protein
LKPAVLTAVNGKWPLMASAPHAERRDVPVWDLSAEVQRSGNTEFEFVLSHSPHLDKIAI